MVTTRYTTHNIILRDHIKRVSPEIQNADQLQIFAVVSMVLLIVWASYAFECDLENNLQIRFVPILPAVRYPTVLYTWRGNPNLRPWSHCRHHVAPGCTEHMCSTLEQIVTVLDTQLKYVLDIYYQ